MMISSSSSPLQDARLLAYFLCTTADVMVHCVFEDPSNFLYTMFAWRLVVLLGYYYTHDSSKKSQKVPSLQKNHIVDLLERLVVAVPLMGVPVYFIGYKAPHNWESNIWVSMIDAFMAVVVVTSPTLTANTATKQADGYSTTVLEMFVWFYTAAGFWKINTHFLDPSASCATVFLAQHLTYYGSAFFGSQLQIQAAAQAAQPWFPYVTIVVELAMGLSLAVVRCFAPGTLGRNRTVSVAMAVVLFFHLGVCVTPRPHDISGFAAQCACRLPLVVPEIEAWRTVLTKCQRHMAWLVALAVLYVSYGVQNSFTPLNWFFGMFTAVSVLDLWATAELPMTETTTTITTKRPYKPVVWMGVPSALAFFYSFGMIPLGLMEEASPNMFANLKIHGGSNHLLLPTGLLFQWAATQESQGNSDSFLVRHWGGGEIRLESTTSQWLTEIYPNDLTHILEPAPTVVELLQEHLNASQPAVYFNSGLNRVLHVRERGFVPPPPHGQFISYTVPALEWKRLLKEAVHYLGRPSFTVDYVHLPGTSGDEEWRAFAWERRIHLEVVNGEITSCTVQWNSDQENTTALCGPNELPYQLKSVPWWLSKLSLYHGYPILYNADGTARPSISCFGP
eukprot:scaffold18122_cov194-Amphora_coffeaeformis.AAC.5